MPSEPLPRDRKDFFRERKNERFSSENLGGGGSARWRDIRRPPGYGKQGGWHMFPGESFHGSGPSRSNDKFLDQESCRSFGKYGRSNRENRGPFSQRDWKGHCWDAAATASQSGIDYEDKGGTFANIQVATEKGLHMFTFKQLHSATGGFGKSNVIGHGGFGLVYRGMLQDGRKVAVKLMDTAGKQGEEEFQVEVELMSRLRSPYLLTLVGYYSESNHKLLVYEFMANGGLQEHLYPICGWVCFS